MIIVTPKGISKRTGAEEISKYSGIPLTNYLGVGDNTSDWKFMELCGYAAAMGNATSELKELVAQKEEGKHFLAGSVDRNGILDVFDYFGL
jgi:hydroxymethylpyrimidine pyrophosphatase-like HAD family hydrolase